MLEVKQEGEDIDEKGIMINKSTTESLLASSISSNWPGQDEENWKEGEKEEVILGRRVRREEGKQVEVKTQRMEVVQRSDSQVRYLLQIRSLKFISTSPIME